MADTNNISEINENFDTIKTLLNSIRAQGVLNTSDMDRLLEGINSKLEKINTEEDVDLIKAYLTELKQNLEERHEVLISKFGAIESLFSNLLKNSSETVKSTELKETFDIIATNLSVFSREVVTQKEAISDIGLRLDAMRSDDTQKKDIIKSVSTVRNDIEKLNNGFDSIVISLNENFKTVLKTVSEIDQSEAIKSFTDRLNDIIDSSNTILSAIQLIDKKNEQYEEAFNGLATQEETTNIQRTLVELSAKSKEISDLVDTLTQKSYKIDNLADKIDASVNIIAGLKAEIADKDDSSKNAILDRLSQMENVVREVSSNDEFAAFKQTLESVFGEIADSSNQLKGSLESALINIGKMNDDLKSLDITSSFGNISSNIEGVGEEIKEKMASESDKLSQLLDVNITRTLNDISSNAEVLNSRIKESHTTIADLCSRNFAEVTENISSLKAVVSQLDDNNVSANNAIFSNITDRLAIFENSLKTSLEKQEDYVSTSSNNVVEQIMNIKNLAEDLDYKLDSSSIELLNSKSELGEIKESVNTLLALDFSKLISELKDNLNGVKEELQTAVDSTENELSEKLSRDLFGKYELLISKLDSVENDIKYAQEDALNGLKNVLDNILSSIVDVLSYVSVAKEAGNEALDTKLTEVLEGLKDSNLNYVENVRDIVDVIRVQVEDNLKRVSAESDGRFTKITSSITSNTQDLKQDIKKAYDKIEEVFSSFDELKEQLNINSLTMSSNVTDILAASDGIKNDFEMKLSALKNTLLDKVTEFKNDFTCENTENLSELKFNAENLHSKVMQQTEDLKNELKTDLSSFIDSLRKNISALNESVANTTLKLEGTNKEIIDFVKNDFTSEVNNSVDTIKTNTADILTEIDIKVADVVNSFTTLETAVNNLSSETTSSFSASLAKILENFVALQTYMKSLHEQVIENATQISTDVKSDFDDLRKDFDKHTNTIDNHLEHQKNITEQSYTMLETLIKGIDEKSREDFRIAIQELNSDFGMLKKKFSEVDSAIDEDLARQISIIEGSFESLNLMLVDIMNQAKDTLGDKIKQELSGASDRMSEALAEELEQYKTQIEELYDELKNQNNEQAEFIKDKALEMNSILEATLDKQNTENIAQLDNLAENLKNVLNENIALTAADYNSLKNKLEDFYNKIVLKNDAMVGSIRAQLDDVTKFIDSNLDVHEEQINSTFEEISNGIQNVVSTVTEFNSILEPKIELVETSIEELKQETIMELDEKGAEIVDKLTSIYKDITDSNLEAAFSRMRDLKSDLETSAGALQGSISGKASEILDQLGLLHTTQLEQNNKLQQIFEDEIKTELSGLNDKIQSMFEESSVNFITHLGNTNTQLSENVNAGVIELKSAIENLNDKMDRDDLSRMNVFQAQLQELNQTFNGLINESKELTKSEIAKISDVLINDVSAAELQTMESFANRILEQIESVKQNSIVCKDLISKLVSEHFDIITKDIEKETDVIVGDIIEQFGILKDTQKDELSNLTSAIEGSVAGYVIDAVNDMKSYMDVRTDSSVINQKLDKLQSELERSVETTAENITKLLSKSVLTDSIMDLRATNEVLLESMTEKLNSEIQSFIKDNVAKRFDDKFNFFDKKFTDTIVDKYEEVKLLSTQYNKSFEKISVSVDDLVNKFVDSKDDINNRIQSLVGGINKSVDELKYGFADLKAQILNKSFDEAFHDSVHNQIAGIENLVKEQMGYIEDISDLCGSNLPELTEMNTIVKYAIQKNISDIKDQIANQDVNIPKALNQLKSDIVTQFINVFNQISFIAEQEEIIDFIQEKHSELITILSHIVTTVDGVETVKENLAVVDNKMDSLKEDIDLINEKITAIMSSDGTVDYVYSLQDLESDIANLRIVLNEMKADNKSEEFEELINSTNGIYQLVEAIKAEMPKFEVEEFKKDFETLSEDIVSISTRTNKLLLSSDESYKTLQDNLQDFKLVINDLDERTRNFAREAGIDKIDNKLATLNSMMQNGAKTNQVFNQVFEYLAEWVDKAGSQIAAISDKVETLDDIGQIKVMLEDLRAEAQDNSESAELVDALSTVFDKQAKKIASLEAKLDRMIVDSTINSKSNKLDLSPIEETLNKFLVAIDDRMLLQQAKINSLDEKLEEVVSLVDNKDTAQLTKKVGGMDKQLAKLNKSIEKIASNVVEK